MVTLVRKYHSLPIGSGAESGPQYRPGILLNSQDPIFHSDEL